jgi:hypothetical protein
MQVARLQHEKVRESKKGFLGIDWELILGNRPVRAIASACAAIMLAAVVLTATRSSHSVVSGLEKPVGMLEMPRSQATSSHGSGEWLGLGEGTKSDWQDRKILHNSLWVSVSSTRNSGSVIVYQVSLSLNGDALLPGKALHRIAAETYVLQPGQYSLDSVRGATPTWHGSVLADSPVQQPVIVGQSAGSTGSLNLLVVWQVEGNEFAQIVMLPPGNAQSTESASDTGIGSDSDSSSFYRLLGSICHDYGVPIIANARLRTTQMSSSLGEGSLGQELRNCLAPVNIDWLFADGAVYVDRKYIKPDSE